MLTEELINQYGEQFVDLFQRLEAGVINDIASRLRKADRWTETAELQAKSLRDIGYSTARIRTEVLRKLRATPEYIMFVDKNTIESKRVIQAEIDATRKNIKKSAPDFYAEVGSVAFNDDLSVWRSAKQEPPTGSALPQLLKTMARRSTGELLDLTKSTAFRINGAIISTKTAFVKTLNDTLIGVLTGAKGSQKAVSESVIAMCESGLRTVDYASGRSYQLDTAARLITRTSCAQVAGDISIMNMQETGVEYVEVSAHWGARPDHAVWQGQIYEWRK